METHWLSKDSYGAGRQSPDTSVSLTGELEFCCEEVPLVNPTFTDLIGKSWASDSRCILVLSRLLKDKFDVPVDSLQPGLGEAWKKLSNDLTPSPLAPATGVLAHIE